MTEIYHPFADLIGLKLIEYTDGVFVCSLPVTESLMNPNKVVHGGALYSLADTGMGGAVYSSLSDGEYTATIEIKISYFKPVRSGEIICKSRIINRGKRIAYLESDLFVNEVIVAKATGSFAILKANRKGF
jgi:acyl-CoA thioesterase